MSQTVTAKGVPEAQSEPGGSALPSPSGLVVAVIGATMDHADGLAKDLRKSGYEVVCFKAGTKIVDEVFEANPGAVVVDTDSDGPQLIQAVAWSRAATNVPIIAVGTTGTLQEMMRCYEFGADDYATPNAPYVEIDLRLRAMFRRVGRRRGDRFRDNGHMVRVGELEIDQVSQEVFKADERVPLSPTEFRLLSILAERVGEVVPAKALIARVWGSEYASETHYLRLYVRYLRQKLEEDPSHPSYIVNQWGSGYALVDPSTEAKAS